MSQASSKLVGSGDLLKKVYFPRLVIPVAAVCAGAVDFLLAFLVLLGMMIFYGILPNLAALWLPMFLLLAVVTALGAGLWLSALNIQFRDIQYVIPFLTQVWLFATPIAYPTSIVPAAWRPLYGLNPMVSVVEGFRWALLGSSTAPGLVVGASTLAALLLLISGAFYFRRMESTFADVV